MTGTDYGDDDLFGETITSNLDDEYTTVGLFTQLYGVMRICFFALLLGLFLLNGLGTPFMDYTWFQELTRLVQTVPERWWMLLIGCYMLHRITEAIWDSVGLVFIANAGLRNDFRTVARQALPSMGRTDNGEVTG